MKISTKGRYGIRVMIELALHYPGLAVMMETIAQNQKISRKYLHSLLTQLKTAGLVRSILGAKGGYVLAQEPALISIYQIVSALEGDLMSVACLSHNQVCEKSGHCAAQKLWQQLSETVNSIMLNTNLEQLALQQKQLNLSQMMYHI